MAVTFQTPGAIVYTANNAGATVAPAPVYPASVASGDALVLIVGMKPDTATHSTPAGWTLLGTYSGGAGTTGIDAGPTKIYVFTLEAASALSGNITMGTSAGQNISWAQCLRSSKTLAMWDIAIAGGADTATGTAWSVLTGNVPAGFIAANDLLIAASVLPTDTAPTYGTETITAQGGGTITLGTATVVTTAGSANSQDIGGRIVRWAPTASTQAAGTLTYLSTLSGTTTNASGPAALIRIRDFNPVTISKSASDTLSASATDVAVVKNVVTASDTLSASVTEGTPVIVPTTPPPIEYLVPNSAITIANWNVIPSGQSWTVIDELTLNTSDYITTTFPFVATFTIGKASGGGLTYFPGPPTIRAHYTASTSIGTLTYHVRILQGVTVITDRTLPEGAFQTVGYTLTSGETSNITDWTNLRIEFQATGSGAVGEFSIFQAHLEVPGTTATDFQILWTNEDWNTLGTVISSGPHPYYAHIDDFDYASGDYLLISPSSFYEGTLTNPIIPAGKEVVGADVIVYAVGDDPTPSNYGISLINSDDASFIVIQSGDFNSTSAQESIVSLSSGELALVHDWNNVIIRLEYSGGPSTVLQVEGLQVILTFGDVSSDTPITASDTLSASVTETAVVKALITASDTLSASVTEAIASTAVTLSASDTLSASVADVGTFPPIPITASDTLSASVTDASAIKAIVAAVDTLAGAITESISFATVAVSASDTLSGAVTESVAIKAALIASDTLSASVTDVGTFATVVVTASDTLSASVTETAVASIIIASTDTLSASVTEVASIQASLVASDTLSASVSENTSFATVVVTASDTLSASVTEAAVVFNDRPGADTLIATLSETSQVVISGLVLKTASDTLTAAVTENVTFATVVVTASDTLSASVTDSGAFSPVSITASDSLSASVADSGSVVTFGQLAKTASDTLSASVTETAAINVVRTASDTLSASVSESTSFGTVAVSASDTLTGAVTESVAIKAGVIAQDTLAGTITETISFATIIVSASDTLSASITETTALTVGKTAVDTLSASVSEITDLQITGFVLKSAADTLSASVTESVNNAVLVSVSDTLAAGLTETAVVKVLITASDTLSAALTESVSFGTVSVNASDTLAASVSEQVTRFIDQPGADLLAASVTDIGQVTVFISASDTLTASVSESADVDISGLVIKSASDDLLAKVTTAINISIFAFTISDKRFASSAKSDTILLGDSRLLIKVDGDKETEKEVGGAIKTALIIR